MLRDRIKQLRLARGLTQVALAKATGVTQSAISAIEKGDIRSLHADTLMRLSVALEADPEFIRTGRTKKEPHTRGLGEDAVVNLYQRLSTQNRKVWIDVGATLVRGQEKTLSETVKIPHNGITDRTARSKQVEATGHEQQDQVARAVLDQLTKILEEHGPDALARAFDYLRGEPPNAHPQPVTEPRSKRDRPSRSPAG